MATLSPDVILCMPAALASMLIRTGRMRAYPKIPRQQLQACQVSAQSYEVITDHSLGSISNTACLLAISYTVLRLAGIVEGRRLGHGRHRCIDYSVLLLAECMHDPAGRLTILQPQSQEGPDRCQSMERIYAQVLLVFLIGSIAAVNLILASKNLSSNCCTQPESQAPTATSMRSLAREDGLSVLDGTLLPCRRLLITRQSSLL